MKRRHESDEEDDDDDDDFLFAGPSHAADAVMFDEDEPLSAMYIDQVPMQNGAPAKAPDGPKFEVQPIVPVRSEKLLLDNVCYFKQQALITLLYANVTQGVRVPGLFDQDQQRL